MVLSWVLLFHKSDLPCAHFFGVRSAHLNAIFRVVPSLKWELNFQKLAESFDLLFWARAHYMGNLIKNQTSKTRPVLFKTSPLFSTDWQKTSPLRFRLKERALFERKPQLYMWYKVSLPDRRKQDYLLIKLDLPILKTTRWRLLG